jgi:hypothetical protein
MSGAWEELEPQIWETVVTPCDCCGQVVAKRLWRIEIDGVDRRFCGPDCEQLYRKYVIPKLKSADAG